jgi:transglutaminase-like putative cysteine protease
MRWNKVLFILFLVISLLPSVMAQPDDELFEYHALNLGLSISNSFSIAPSGENPSVSSVSAELFWHPMDDYRQAVDFINTEPRSDLREDHGLVFRWTRPTQTSFNMMLDSRLSTTSEFLPVRKRTPFPLKDLDPSYSQYIQPEQIIDINDEIRSLASKLAEGQDDQYVVVVKLADWVENNVEYNLSSITADASQTSSWVLENRRGVCDELTSLFISMCRSLGIPARFVSGISYSNVNFQNDGWGPHGWAEVYFPDVGWVPFDTTYKELGYIDATHIKLKTSIDAKETSVEYSMLGTDMSISPGPLDFTVSINGKDYKTRPIINMEADPVEPRVGVSSFNLITVKVKNPNNYYVTDRLYLVNVTDLEISGESNYKTVVLAPQEEKKLFWLVKVSDSLNPDYVYTFPIKVVAGRGGEAEANFKAGDQYKVFSEEYMKSYSDSDAGLRDYPELKLGCYTDKNETYAGETVRISCRINNTGNNYLSRLRVCLDKDCDYASLVSGNLVTFNYTKVFDTLGVKTLTFRAENDAAKRSYYVIIDVLDKPLVDIMNLSYPPRISYGDQSEVKIILKRSSSNIPQNVKIRLEHSLINEEWSLTSLETSYELRFLFKGSNLDFEQNPFKLVVTYEDAQGKEYKTEKDFTITLNNPTIFQRLMVWVNILDVRISNWFSGVMKSVSG